MQESSPSSSQKSTRSSAARSTPTKSSSEASIFLVNASHRGFPAYFCNGSTLCRAVFLRAILLRVCCHIEQAPKFSPSRPRPIPGSSTSQSKLRSPDSEASRWTAFKASPCLPPSAHLFQHDALISVPCVCRDARVQIKCKFPQHGGPLCTFSILYCRSACYIHIDGTKVLIQHVSDGCAGNQYLAAPQGGSSDQRIQSRGPTHEIAEPNSPCRVLTCHVFWSVFCLVTKL